MMILGRGIKILRMNEWKMQHSREHHAVRVPFGEHCFHLVKRQPMLRCLVFSFTVFMETK